MGFTLFRRIDPTIANAKKIDDRAIKISFQCHSFFLKTNTTNVGKTKAIKGGYKERHIKLDMNNNLLSFLANAIKLIR